MSAEKGALRTEARWDWALHRRTAEQGLTSRTEWLVSKATSPKSWGESQSSFSSNFYLTLEPFLQYPRQKTLRLQLKHTSSGEGFAALYGSSFPLGLALSESSTVHGAKTDFLFFGSGDIP